MEQYSILAGALDEVISQDINDYLATVDFSVKHEFSPKYQRRTAKLIRWRGKPYYQLICTAGRRAACIAAAVVLLCSVAMSFEDVRATVKEFFTKAFSDHIVMEAHPEAWEDDPDTIETVYEITALPDGFVLVDSVECSTYVYADYIYGEYYIDFIQYTYATFRANIDNENTEREVYFDNENQEYTVFIYKNGDISVFWTEGGYVLSIDSNLNKEEVLALCTSTKMQE